MYIKTQIRIFINTQIHIYTNTSILKFTNAHLPDIHGARIEKVFVFLETSESEQADHYVPDVQRKYWIKAENDIIFWRTWFPRRQLCLRRPRQTQWKSNPTFPQLCSTLRHCLPRLFSIIFFDAWILFSFIFMCVHHFDVVAAKRQVTVPNGWIFGKGSKGEGVSIQKSMFQILNFNPICQLFAYICANTRTSALKKHDFSNYKVGKGQHV